MFNTPPAAPSPPRGRGGHLAPGHVSIIRTRRALKEELEKMRDDVPAKFQSEIIEPTSKVATPERPKSEAAIVKTKSVTTRKSDRSFVSFEARKKRLELEAAEAKAEIEKQIIDKRLAADLAALERQSAKSHLGANTGSAQRVEQWLEHSHLAELQAPAEDTTAGDVGGQLHNLASAICEANEQNKRLISRFAGSKDLPTFHGDAMEWLAFKQAYDESTDICNFSEAENMWRLRRSLRGEARETVSSLLIGNTAPHIIVEALNLRYGRPELIINKITTNLKKISPLPQHYHQDIVSFSIKIKNFVAAAKAIQQEDYLRSPELVTSVLTKFPAVLINKWADYYCGNSCKPQAKLELLADFLYDEASKIANAGLTYIHTQPERGKTDIRKPHSVLLGNRPVDTPSSNCKFCHISCHQLPACARFKRAMKKDRWRFVRTNKLCHKCLLATHNRDTCSAAACDVDECNLPHHPLLHWTSKNSAKNCEHSSESKNIDKNDLSADNETVAHTITNTSVFLKIVPIDIQGPSGELVSTHALLDDGATVSLISADIADRVNLYGTKQTLSVRGAWDSKLTCESENVKFVILNKNKKPFEINAQKINQLNLPTQKISAIQLNKYEHLKHLDNKLQIKCSDNIKPKLLLGQDNYHLLAPIKTLMRTKSEPCATLTALGWCIHGVCPTRRGDRSLHKDHAMVTTLERPISAILDPHTTCFDVALAIDNTTATTTDASTESTSQSAQHDLDASYAKTHTDQDRKYDELHELVKKSFEFESIGVSNQPRVNKEDLKAVEIVDTSAILKNEQWEISLPWRDCNSQMADSYYNAFNRLKSIEKKMSRDPEYASKYRDRIKHLLDNDYARKIEPTEDDNHLKLWYLPHFGVDNPNNKEIQLNSRLRTLTPYLDNCNILRVGRRVEAVSNVSLDAKRPVILDGRHPTTRLIVKHYHEKYAHGNNETVVNELRQRYWVVNLRPTVRTVAARCQYCRIRRAAPMTPRMADLPPGRLAHHQRPFTHCGVDLFGPIEITVGRRRERRYGVLFTCMTVRAVHIEVVASLTTDSFLMGLRRMACRRGWPKMMYSDNGTNLRGADAELRKSLQDIDQTEIKNEMTNRGVSWNFISPISPHKGGAWERLIRSVKTALRVTLKERAPREETLVTLLTEVESVVNSRPLTHVSVDPRYTEALTPNHFLIGSSSEIPVPGKFDDGDLYLRKMWRTAQRLTDLFWQRWVKEYLPELVPRQKWNHEVKNLEKGDVVIVVDPNLPRNTWLKGIVENVYPGTDGRVRTVDLRTKTGILTRPATRLALVPMADECLDTGRRV